jgi:hypothetical protein
MQCKYRYSLGDRIPSGKIVTDQCGSPAKKGHEYCIAHLRAKKLIPIEEERKIKQRFALSQEKRVENKKEIEKKLEESNRGARGYEDILDGFDLEKACEAHKEDVLWERNEFKRSLFVQWWCAVPEERNPRSWKEAAGLLGVTHSEVVEWVRGKDWATLVTQAMREYFIRALPFVARSVTSRMVRGDKAAVSEIAKFIREAGGQSVSEPLFSKKTAEAARKAMKGKGGLVDKGELDFLVDSLDVDMLPTGDIEWH